MMREMTLLMQCFKKSNRFLGLDFLRKFGFWLMIAALGLASVRVFPAVDQTEHRVSLTGSDTLSPLLAIWAEQLTRHAPWVTLEIQASGSATAPIALAKGSAVIGPMSRRMTREERQRIKVTRGREPLEWPLALDAVALFVHPSNPLNGLSLQEVEQVFAEVPLCTPNPTVERWGELPSYQQTHHPKQAWFGRFKLRLIGRSSLSGTHHHVRSKALCGGLFRTGMAELPSAASVIQAVAREPSAIGYASLSAKASGVKPLHLDGIKPGAVSIQKGTYPWSRTLYLYVMPPASKEASWPQGLWKVLSWIYGEQGQMALVARGFTPIADQDLKQIQSFIQKHKPVFTVTHRGVQ